MTASAPIGVLCVDDNEHVAFALAMKLRKAGGFEWRGRLESADHLAATAAGDCPGIILLDLDMPGRDPFDAVAEMLGSCPGVRVIVFSGHVRKDLLDRAISVGVWGYVSKSDGEDALLDGIRGVSRGEFALSPEVRAICERC